MTALKSMISKFKGTCFRCGNAIPKDSPIEWSKETGAKHVDCSKVTSTVAAINLTQLGDFAEVYAMFANAAKTNKFPKITFDADGFEFYLYVSGPQATLSGVINVKGKGWHEEWYGRITEAGEWTHRHAVDERMADALSKLAMDPVGTVAAYGKLSGRCVFCNIELTDEKSTDVGYGPVCAKKWALPWGKKAKATKFALIDPHEAVGSEIFESFEAAEKKAKVTGKPVVTGSQVAWDQSDG